MATELKRLPEPSPGKRKGRERQRAYDERQTHALNDIGKLPPIKDPDRRLSCQHSLQLFLETYFPGVFNKSWSPDHLETIHKTEQALRDGTYFAVAMPRGSGKSSIHQRAALWALLYGHCEFVMVVCADALKARQSLRSIKTELELNAVLSHDFPDVCFPIRKLSGNSIKTKFQHIEGRETRMVWTAEEVVLPTVWNKDPKTKELVKGKTSGSILRVAGITAASRGAQYTLEDQEGHVTSVIRPNLILVDDFQTRESAASPTQSQTRLQIMAGDLGGMAGPGEKLSMLATMTVVYQGDAADQLLTRKLHPEWHGVRKKLVYKWPTSEKLWDEYIDLRREEMLKDLDHSGSTKFYEKHRKEMDEGAVVGWDCRYRTTELSSLQHAYNLKMLDEEAFASEYQNEPLSQLSDDLDFLSTDQISSKLNKLQQGEVLTDVEKITCGIDVQGNSLWWVICGWSSNFNGQVLDYGVFPDQGRKKYTAKSLSRTFDTIYPGYNEEEAIYRALEELGEKLQQRRWNRDDGARMSISRCFIDEGYKDKTVHLFCRQHSGAELFAPAKGMGIGAGRPPMSEWAKKRGEKLGTNWRMRLGVNDRTIRHCVIDTNSWKTFIHERWAVPMGGRGCLSLWGNNPAFHRLFAEHMTNETYAVTEGHGRRVVDWRIKPAKPDQHWFDCMVYCTVAANEQGISLMPEPSKPRKKESRYQSVADRRRKKEG